MSAFDINADPRLYEQYNGMELSREIFIRECTPECLFIETTDHRLNKPWDRTVMGECTQEVVTNLCKKLFIPKVSLIGYYSCGLRQLRVPEVNVQNSLEATAVMYNRNITGKVLRLTSSMTEMQSCNVDVEILGITSKMPQYINCKFNVGMAEVKLRKFTARHFLQSILSRELLLDDDGYFRVSEEEMKAVLDTVRYPVKVEEAMIADSKDVVWCRVSF